MDERELRERLRKIEALFARAGSEGERVAAGAALQRIRERLAEARRTAGPVQMKFTFPDMWARRLFVALCRRYELEPFRYKRQRYTTVMLKVPQHFVDVVLWPEFQALDEALRQYLDEATNRIIREEVHGDLREAEEVDEPAALGGHRS